MSPEMKSALDLVCQSVNKKYGKGSVMKFTETPIFDPESVIPTKSISLNSALGIGGWPRGRIVELWGGESSGKTTTALEAIANTQKKGLKCLFIDAEHALDLRYAEQLGVDVSELYISQPDCGEDALNIANDFIRSGELGLVVVDSVAALTPRAELEGDMADHSVGGQARLMSKAMRMIIGTAQKTNTLVMFLNQTRSKIGVMFGSPVTTSGGNALKFYASVRVKISRTGKSKEKQEVTGNTTKIEVVKNKCAPPFKIAEFNIKFGKGTDTDSELLDLATDDLIIVKSGAWFKYKGENIGQGKDNTIEWLTEHPEEKELIKKEVLENRGL